MDNFEKLVKSIMKDAKKDGEPMTKEEAEEVARMEMGARGLTNDKPITSKKVINRTRKIDDDKKFLLSNIGTLVEGIQLNEGQQKGVSIKTETELSFDFRGNNYTLKLIKHRPQE